MKNKKTNPVSACPYLTPVKAILLIGTMACLSLSQAKAAYIFTALNQTITETFDADMSSTAIANGSTGTIVSYPATGNGNGGAWATSGFLANGAARSWAYTPGATGVASSNTNGGWRRDQHPSGSTTNFGLGFAGNGTIGTAGNLGGGNATAQFVNSTGGTVTSLTVAYDDFTTSTAGNPITITLYYSTDGTTYNAVAGSAWVAGSGDKSAATNSYSISGLNVSSGSSIYLQWQYTGARSTSTGGAIDNVSVTALGGGGPTNVSIGAGTTFTPTSFGGSAFAAANAAVFDGAGTTINLSGAVVAAQLTFVNSGYTLAGSAGNTIAVPAVSVSSGVNATISGQITGTNSLAITGGGHLTLSGSNDFSGGSVSVSSGTLTISSDANLGNVANSVALSGATLQTTASITSGRTFTGIGALDIAAGTSLTNTGTFNMTSVVITNSGTLNLQGSTRNLGALSFTAPGSIIGAGAITLSTLTATGLTSGTAVITTDINFTAGGKTVDVGAGGALELDGFVTLNAARLTKTGLGTLILNGSNDGGITLGSTTADGGTIVINSANSLGTSLAQFFDDGGTLQATTDLTGANAMFIGVSVGGQAAAATFAGSNMEFAGVSSLFQNATGTNRIVVNNVTTLSGAFTSGTTGKGLVVGGVGTLALTGPVSMGVNTRVTDSATLVVNSTWTGTSGSGSTITVDAGATIKGGGTIIGGLTVNGTIAPGNSPGLLTVDNLTLGSTATAVMELAGTSRGIDYDAINVTGLLTLDGTIKVSLISGFDPTLGTTFDLLDWGSLVNNVVAFDFSDAVLDSGLGWDTTNFAVDGTISVVAIPEPSTVGLVIGGLGLLAWRVAKRRSSTFASAR